MSGALRIANCSGFYGDRLSAAREMVDGGPVDVLTGDWLAELTMLILAKNQLRDPAAGYARTFVTQMEQVMGDCLARGIKVVSNAGGLSPRGCAAAVAEVADRLGLAPRIAYVAGDDLMPRLAELRAAGVDFRHLETGEPLGDRPVLTANAYLGGWGIAEALGRGADIVVTGRVTDAALVVGPAAWHHGWAHEDWDALAGAVVAGHVIECGAQATGGNYAFFAEVPGLEHPGFPIAEVEADGSSVITKHPGHGGQVSVGTVTAQLLYEIGAPRYLNPDVTARFDTIRLEEAGADRVRISGVRGEPPPATAKVSLNYQGGWRSTTTLYLTGLDIEAKAALVERALWSGVPGGRDAFAAVDVQLLRTDKPDPATNEEAAAELRITVKDPDERKVGRAFSARITELALSSYPGLYGGGPTAGASAYGVFWPAVVPADLVAQEVVLDGATTVVDAVVAPVAPVGGPGVPAPARADEGTAAEGAAAEGPSAAVPLGRLFGARSGDKGGNANLGVWARDDAAFAWLEAFLTTDRIQSLLPETAPLRVVRHDLPNMRALNFVITGLLGEGVAASTRRDGQAKSLGEWLRARVVDVPESLLTQGR
ncbi:MAG TPA: acyclic terpene utilization AtuA family protein [Acidimicrobiales bacterium]|nr:acyclic terpene utilization AtuA family protein [Acidimicrobiales bacterium]